MHYGLLPRANRGVFAINELPDLAGKIQVGLFNILQEGDVQIKGYPVRLPLDVLLVFTANPEDYTARGKIVTPLKDRIGSEIRTHYPATRESAHGHHRAGGVDRPVGRRPRGAGPGVRPRGGRGDRFPGPRRQESTSAPASASACRSRASKTSSRMPSAGRSRRANTSRCRASATSTRRCRRSPASSNSSTRANSGGGVGRSGAREGGRGERVHRLRRLVRPGHGRRLVRRGGVVAAERLGPGRRGAEAGEESSRSPTSSCRAGSRGSRWRRGPTRKTRCRRCATPSCEALLTGGLLPDGGRRPADRSRSEATRVERIVERLIRQLEQEGYITSGPGLDAERRQRQSRPEPAAAATRRPPGHVRSHRQGARLPRLPRAARPARLLGAEQRRAPRHARPLDRRRGRWRLQACTRSATR